MCIRDSEMPFLPFAGRLAPTDTPKAGASLLNVFHGTHNCTHKT